jgi:tripartite motif-containing protein 71
MPLSTRTVACIIALSLLATSTALAASPPPFAFSFDGTESDPAGELDNPRSVAIYDDELYVTSYSNRHVVVFDLDGNYQRHWGSFGSGDGQFQDIRQISISPDGDVYVSDDGLHRVQKFTTDGTFVLKWGSLGNGDTQFWYPQGIAFDQEGDVWVVDRLNSALKEFDNLGNFKSKFLDSKLNGATDIVMNDDATYVVIWSNSRGPVEKWDADWNYIGRSNVDYRAPQGMTQAPNGDLIVVDGGPGNRISIVNPVSLEEHTTWTEYGPQDTHLLDPYDAAVSPNGDLYIAEFNTNLILVFAPEPSASALGLAAIATLSACRRRLPHTRHAAAIMMVRDPA